MTLCWELTWKTLKGTSRTLSTRILMWQTKLTSTGFLLKDTRVNWVSFRGHRYSLKRTKMKVKTKAWDNVYPRIKRQSIKASTFPPGNARAFDCRSFRGVRNLNLVLVGWAIWTGLIKFLQRNTRVLSFNMEPFKGKEFTFASRSLTRKGLQESHSRWSCLL